VLMHGIAVALGLALALWVLILSIVLWWPDLEPDLAGPFPGGRSVRPASHTHAAAVAPADRSLDI
jgi:hypothetical protein